MLIPFQYPHYLKLFHLKNFLFLEYYRQKINCNGSVITEGNQLRFTWTPDLTYAHNKDHAILVAYAPSLKEAVYTLCGAKRSVGTDVLILPGDWKGITIETYLSFKAENSILCTNSIYLGQIK